MSIHRFVLPDAGKAAEACAHQVLFHLENALSANGTATFAVSGGNSPRALFECLVAARFDWSRVHLFWVDERCVPVNHPQSNFRMADQAFLIPARFPHRNAHRVYTELRPDRAAERYAEDIRAVFDINDGQVPALDLVHPGIGADGHTASLFPGDPLIADREVLTAAVYAEKLAQYRVTMLPAILVNAKHTVVYSPGADKAPVIRDVWEAPYDPVRLPAQLVRHSRQVSWFLDEPAAAQLT
ncbi:MAG: 6-phosphogluconolactonase [Acidobacteria bacterium]|nr:6-phosphogluconolactonase [Acidobacteriota bacterium]